MKGILEGSMKKFYIVRHCEAIGQPPEAELTEKGFVQARYLCEFFNDIKIDRVISSPFLRAIQSVQQIIDTRNISMEIDNRLSERLLSTKDLPDWFVKLKDTFSDVHLKYEGGESSQEAMDRAGKVVDDVLNSEDESILLVTHGNLMSLLLRKYNEDFGFEAWKNLSNPDVYLLSMENNEGNIKRLWRDEATGYSSNQTCLFNQSCRRSWENGRIKIIDAKSINSKLKGEKK
jgi:2,3-bisphosphoglycerate-dependent phosphoglycerate mutase